MKKIIFSCFQTLNTLYLVDNIGNFHSAVQKMSFSSQVPLRMYNRVLTPICGKQCLS